MKALTVRQPWAWLILHAGKHLENRSWASRCRHRGPVLIHAARRIELGAWSFVRELGWDGKLPGDAWQRLPAPADIDTGCIVGQARLDGVVRSSESPWFMGPEAFVLRDVVAYDEPVPCAGQLGLWRPRFATNRSAR